VEDFVDSEEDEVEDEATENEDEDEDDTGGIQLRKAGKKN